MEKLSLTLFITGQTLRSRSAVYHLRKLSDEVADGQYELTIIDVLEHPHLAEEAKVIATPTLVKTSPPPIRRIVGDLANTREVLRWLDLEGDTGKWTGSEESA
jgi:circadian clock protein KaiB